MPEAKCLIHRIEKSTLAYLSCDWALPRCSYCMRCPNCLPVRTPGKSVAASLSFTNIGLPPMIFGFAILLLEALGAVSFVFGYFFRATCTILFILFGLYFFNYFKIGYNTLMLWSLGLAAVFFGLIYVGPGRYSIAVKLEKK